MTGRSPPPSKKKFHPLPKSAEAKNVQWNSSETPASAENRGGRTGECGKGKEKETSRRGKNKRRNPRKEKGTAGPGRPASQWEGESLRVGERDPGEASAEREAHHGQGSARPTPL